MVASAILRVVWLANSCLLQNVNMVTLYVVMYLLWAISRFCAHVMWNLVFIPLLIWSMKNFINNFFTYINCRNTKQGNTWVNQNKCVISYFQVIVKKTWAKQTHFLNNYYCLGIENAFNCLSQDLVTSSSLWTWTLEIREFKKFLFENEMSHSFPKIKYLTELI